MTQTATLTFPIAIACDHAGVALKTRLIAYIKHTWSQEAEDLGTHSDASVDYPDYAHALATWMKDKPKAKGILICGSGIGISIAANRHNHIRAALCTNATMAELARQHNDANVLVLGARIVDEHTAEQCIHTFLTTPFEGGRHQKRIDKL